MGGFPDKLDYRKCPDSNLSGPRKALDGWVCLREDAVDLLFVFGELVFLRGCTWDLSGSGFPVFAGTGRHVVAIVAHGPHTPCS